jgi:hypothetical protein
MAPESQPSVAILKITGRKPENELRLLRYAERKKDPCDWLMPVLSEG